MRSQVLYRAAQPLAADHDCQHKRQLKSVPASVAHFASDQDLSSPDGFLGCSHAAEVLCQHGFNSPGKGCRGLIMGVYDGSHNLHGEIHE